MNNFCLDDVAARSQLYALPVYSLKYTRVYSGCTQACSPEIWITGSKVKLRFHFTFLQCLSCQLTDRDVSSE